MTGRLIIDDSFPVREVCTKVCSKLLSWIKFCWTLLSRRLVLKDQLLKSQYSFVLFVTVKIDFLSLMKMYKQSFIYPATAPSKNSKIKEICWWTGGRKGKCQSMNKGSKQNTKRQVVDLHVFVLVLLYSIWTRIQCFERCYLIDYLEIKRKWVFKTKSYKNANEHEKLRYFNNWIQFWKTKTNKLCIAFQLF